MGARFKIRSPYLVRIVWVFNLNVSAFEGPAIGLRQIKLAGNAASLKQESNRFASGGDI